MVHPRGERGVGMKYSVRRCDQRARTIVCGWLVITLFTGGAGWAQTTPPPPPSTHATSPVIRGEMDPSRDFDDVRSRTSRNNPYEQYRRALALSQCAVKLSPQRASDLLAEQPASVGENTALGRFFGSTSGCIRSSTGMPLALMRGAVAEILILKTDRRRAESTIALSDYDKVTKFVAAEADRNRLRSRDDVALMRTAQCQAASLPGLARNVLETEHGSAEEEEALNDLQRRVPSCGNIDRVVGSTRSFFRAYLSESVFEWYKEVDTAAAIASGRQLHSHA